MWDRVEFAARGAVRGVVASVGSAPVSLALLALSVSYHAAAGLWARLGDPDRAWALSGSPAFGLLAVAVSIDAGTALARDLRRWARASSTGEGRPARARLSLDAAWALFGLALVLSYFARIELRVWAEPGETFEGRPGQVLAVTAGRPLSGRPPLVAFTLQEVVMEGGKTGGPGLAGARISLGDRIRWTSRYVPTWIGWDSVLFATRGGLAPRFVVAQEDGRVLAVANVKLRLSENSPGDSIGARSIPHRIYLRLADEGRSDPTLDGTQLQADVYRGKVPIASGLLSPGKALDFEGLSVRLVDYRYWAEFRIVRDPGLPLTLLAAVAAVVAGLQRLLGTRRAS